MSTTQSDTHEWADLELATWVVTHTLAGFCFFQSAGFRLALFSLSGKPLQLTLQACDVKGKEDKSGPENLLVEPWTRDGEWWPACVS